MTRLVTCNIPFPDFFENTAAMSNSTAIFVIAILKLYFLTIF